MGTENPSLDARTVTAGSPRRLTPSAELTDAGMSAAVAAELERRIALVSAEETERDPSRRPLSATDLVQYIAVTLGFCAFGLVVLFL